MRSIIILLCMISFSVSCNSKTNSRAFNFVYTVVLEESKGNKLELWLPIPKSNVVQTITDLEIQTQGLDYQIKEEYEHNNKYVYIYSENGINESKTVTMSFDVLRKKHQNIYYQDVTVPQYLKASNLVPKGEVFSQVIKENKLSSADMRGLYNFVLSGMHYGKPKSVDDKYFKEPWLSADKEYGLKKVSRNEVVNLYQKAETSGGIYTFGNGNSLYACDIGVGNCTDYHSYFISLSRTMNVPARFHMGFTIPDGKGGDIRGYHCWADYYVENEGWYPVDISEADKDQTRQDYFFGTICNNRVEMMVGRDFKIDGYGEDRVNFFIYPLLEINDKKSDAFSKSFTYKNL